MAKSDRSTDSIEKLLEERSQYQQWLARLEGSAAPDTVKTRVRADYEARLDTVLGQLRSHESTIVEALAQHEAELATLESREASILETLAEAEVRHAVGEYEDKQWSEISSGQKKSLHEVRAGLERLRGEVGRLTEVQRLIRAAPPEPEAPVPALAEPAAFAPPVAPTPEPQAPPPAPPAAEPPAPRYVPKPPAPTPAQRLAGDELDFLKSVAVDQSASLSPAAAEKQRNASSPMVTTGSPAEPPAPAPAPASAPSAARGPAAPSAAGKTLKCGDCGTLNRPTEWYCERCGAELAAL